jgi:hypothetical protein
MGVGSVMVLRLVIYGAATKPRASCGRAHKDCAARHAQVSRIPSHDPLWSYTDVLSFRELFLGYLSLSCQKIFVLNPDVSFVKIWNLDSWIQPF